MTKEEEDYQHRKEKLLNSNLHEDLKKIRLEALEESYKKRTIDIREKEF